MEDWESEKTESDWERYYWEESKSKESIVDYIKHIKPEVKESEIINDEAVKSYAKSVSKLFDEKENKNNLEEYKQNVLKLLFWAENHFTERKPVIDDRNVKSSLR